MSYDDYRRDYYRRQDDTRDYYRNEDRRYDNIREDLEWDRKQTKLATERAQAAARANDTAGVARAYGMYDQAIDILQKQSRREQSYTPPAQRALAYLNAAVAQIDAGNFYGAITNLDTALVFDATLAVACYWRAYAHNELGNIDAAITDYTSAIRHGCNEWYVYDGRAMAYRKKNEYTKAVADFSEVIRQKPDLLNVYLDRGFLRNKSKDYHGAIADADYVIAHGSRKDQLCDAYNLRGLAYFDQEKFGRAIKNFQHAIAYDPQLAYSYLCGQAQQLQREHRNAIDSFSVYLTYRPDSEMAWHARGYNRLMIGEYVAAINDLTKAIQLKPDFPYAYTDRGRCYFELKDYANAIADFTAAINLNGKEKPFFWRALAYEATDKFQEAIDDYSALLREDPKRAHAYSGRAFRRWKLGDTEGALSDYNKAIELDPAIYNAFCQRGRIHAELKQPRKALADFNEAVKIAPDSGVVYMYRGDYLRDNGEYEKAMEDYKKGAALYQQKGEDANYERAMKDYEEVAKQRRAN